MNRQEFPKPVKREIVKRASIIGIPTCERIENGARCGCTKGLDINHKDMDAMKLIEAKRKPLTADDGELICKPHHNEETAIQVSDLSKAIRVEDKRLGINGPKKGFAKVSKEKPQLRVANGTPEIMRRFRAS